MSDIINITVKEAAVTKPATETIKAKDIAVSLYKLESLFGERKFAEPHMINRVPSFYIEGHSDPKYVNPNFSAENKVIKEGKVPKIILVAAAGATGKSDLTKYLSATLRMPVLDLAKHKGVGANSLTGLFFETLGPIGLGTFVSQLQSGNGTMIIDALDEGSIKTHVGAFNAFLDEVANIAAKSIGTPFILLGRTNIVDDCTFYFLEKGLEVELLHIEPFTVDQARVFIDNRVGNVRIENGKIVRDEIRFNESYREVRDFIIDSVQGFFSNEREINKESVKSSSQMFIGYAPVLLAISELLRKDNKSANYQVLLQQLSERNDKGVDLILTIAGMILERDKRDKVIPAIADELLKGRPAEFVNYIRANIYSEEEQCVRLLYYLMGKPLDLRPTDDTLFNAGYEKKIEQWLKEHPFINNGSRKFQNVVFECYVLAKLMLIPAHKELVLQYLKLRYKDAFMLFFIWQKLSADKTIHSDYLPYLYHSFQSLDSQLKIYSMEVVSTVQDDVYLGNISCEVRFEIRSDHPEEFVFDMKLPTGTVLTLFGDVTNVQIDAPIDLAFRGDRVKVGSPLHIACSNIVVDVKEFVVDPEEDEDIQLEAENRFEVDYSSGRMPEIEVLGNGEANLYITAESRPTFPFYKYYVDPQDLNKLDGRMVEKFLRLRKILTQFKTNRLDGFGKLKQKIDHRRVKGNGVGAAVLDRLKESGIIYSDAHLYRLDMDAVHEQLGLTYQDLRAMRPSAKVIEFLKEI